MIANIFQCCGTLKSILYWNFFKWFNLFVYFDKSFCIYTFIPYCALTLYKNSCFEMYFLLNFLLRRDSEKKRNSDLAEFGCSFWIIEPEPRTGRKTYSLNVSSGQIEKPTAFESLNVSPGQVEKPTASQTKKIRSKHHKVNQSRKTHRIKTPRTRH